MFPPLGLEGVADFAKTDKNDSALARDAADVCDWHSRNAGRNALARRCGEKEFVILASVQGQLEIDFVRRFADGRPRNGGCVNLRSDAAFFADVIEIGGEPVACVNHRGGQSTFAQDATEFEARLGKKVPWILWRPQLALRPRSHFRDSGCRAAEVSTDIDEVPGTRSRSH